MFRALVFIICLVSTIAVSAKNYSYKIHLENISYRLEVLSASPIGSGKCYSFSDNGLHPIPNAEIIAKHEGESQTLITDIDGQVCFDKWRISDTITFRALPYGEVLIHIPRNKANSSLAIHLGYANGNFHVISRSRLTNAILKKIKKDLIDVKPISEIGKKYKVRIVSEI